MYIIRFLKKPILQTLKAIMSQIHSLINENTLPKIREFDGHDWSSTRTQRRNLPHWELIGSTYFITVCVDSSLGKPFFDPLLAKTLITYLHRDDKQKYLLYAYVIMPDHLHIIIKPLAEFSLPEIMQRLKGGSAYSINKLLNRTGKFWQKESFDHLIRDGLGLREKWDYIKENPVKANIIEHAEDYPFSSFYVSNNLG